MIRQMISGAALSLGLMASSAFATDLSALSQAEREAFRAEVREFLEGWPLRGEEASLPDEERERIFRSRGIENGVYEPCIVLRHKRVGHIHIFVNHNAERHVRPHGQLKKRSPQHRPRDRIEALDFPVFGQMTRQKPINPRLTIHNTANNLSKKPVISLMQQSAINITIQSVC